MAGVYGEIDSRATYHRVLGEATEYVRGILNQRPDHPTLQRILKELGTMKRWTENGREPRIAERASVEVGLIAARELSGATQKEGLFIEKLFALNNYFEDWPTDEDAATASNGDSIDSQ
jgi:hypothetical protein